MQKIQEVQKRIQKRLSEYREDPLGLPETCPNDNVKKSLSRKGHRRLVNEDKALLARLEAEYCWKCTGGSTPLPPPVPQPVRSPRPLSPPNRSPWQLVGLGILIIIVTVGEDILTAGGGVIDDPLTIGAGGALILKGAQILTR
jgi:hypothetical protein